MKYSCLTCAAFLILPLVLPPEAHAGAPAVVFKQDKGAIHILVHGRPFATYHFHDDKILRPFFAQVRAPDGTQVTRNHPPKAGSDDMDHATFHPGLWWAFGAIGGHDTWRNQARVVHDKLQLAKDKYADRAGFTVHNLYFAKDAKEPFAREETRCSFIAAPMGNLLLWSTKIYPLLGELRFGDQEEMGLGVRLATPLTVKKGGRILNSDGKKNEKEVRGTTPKWCEYSGLLGGKRVGVTLLVDETNIQPTYFHVRDYGLMVANMFGRKTFTGKDSTSPILRPPSHVPLRYGVLTFAVDPDRDVSAEAYRLFMQELDRPQPAP